MTNRYAELLASIKSADAFIVTVFIFAVVMILAYRSLDWVQPFMRRPMKYFYLTCILFMFILTTVYSKPL